MPTNVWDANGGTKPWSTAGNWSLGHKPAAGEDIVIDGTGSAICNLDEATAALGSLTISAGNGFIANAWSISVAGTVAITGGAADFGTSTVTISGTGNLSNTTLSTAFWHLTLSGAITTTLTGDVVIEGTFTTSGATSTIQDNAVSSRNLELNGTSASFVNNGPTWAPTSGGFIEIVLDNVNTMTLPGDVYGSTYYMDLFINDDGTNITIGGDVTFRQIRILDQSTVSQGSNTVTVNGTGAVGLELGGGPGNSGATWNLQTGTLDIAGILQMYGGSVDANTLDGGSGTIQVAGDWAMDTADPVNPVFTRGTSTVIFDGSGAQDFDPGGQSFYDIDIAGSGTVELQGVLTCNILDIQTGTFDTKSGSSYAVTCEGGFTQSGGTCLPRGSTVTISGGNCSITGGTFTAATSTFDLTGTGTVTNSSTARAFWILKCAADTKTTTITGGDVFLKKLEFGIGTLTGTAAYRFQYWLPPAGKVLTNAGVTVNATGGGNPALYVGPVGGALSLTLDGINMGAGIINFQGGSNGLFTMLGDLTTTGPLTIRNDNTNSTLDMDTFNLTCGALTIGAAANANSAILLCGSGIVDCTSFSTFATSSGALTLNMESCTFRCSGDFAINHANHVLTPGTSTTEFDGSTTQDITLNGESFNIVDVTGTSVVELQDDFYATNFTLTTGTFDTNSVGSQSMFLTTFDMNGGIFNANNSAIVVGGNCTIDAGTANFGTSTVTITASGNLSNATEANAFASFTQSSSIITTLTDKVYIDNSATMGAGATFQTDGTNRSLVLDGALTVNTVTWSGNGATLVVIFTTNATSLPGDDYGDAAIHVLRANVSVCTLTGALVTTGKFYIRSVSTNQTPKCDSGGFSITCGELQIGIDGSTSRGGRLTLSGNSDLTISGITLITEANGSTAYSEIIVSTAGTSTIDFNGNVTLRAAAGTGIDAQAATIKIAADWLNEGGYFTYSTSTVELDGAVQQDVTSAGESFNDVKVTNTTAAVRFIDAMDVQGTFKPGNGASTVTIQFATSGTHHWEAVDTSLASGTGTIDLNSIGGAASWALTIGSNQTVTSIDVAYSNLTGFTIDATDSTNVDGGNNSANWQFGAPTDIFVGDHAVARGVARGVMVGVG